MTSGSLCKVCRASRQRDNCWGESWFSSVALGPHIANEAAAVNDVKRLGVGFLLSTCAVYIGVQLYHDVDAGSMLLGGAALRYTLPLGGYSQTRR